MPYFNTSSGAVSNRTPLALKIFVVLGSLMVLGAIALTVRQTIFVTHAQMVEGTLDRMTPVYGQDGTTWKPTFTFQTQAGQKVTVQSSVSTSSSGYTPQPGDTVPILYDPAHPQHAEINSFMRLWFAPTLVGAMGTFFLLLVGAIAWLSRSGGMVRVDNHL